MNILPTFKENAYLTLLIKDNFIYANLAYSNLIAQRTFLLSDSTDLSPLKFRLDDITFTKEFWFEYFDSLEKFFDWDIVDRTYEGIFKIKGFEHEEVGVSGIKVLIDDNQPFFKNIFISLKDFSRDISIKILDDKYINQLMYGFVQRMGYSQIYWIDLDISHFSIYTAKTESISSGVFNKERIPKTTINSSKIDWGNEIGLIDFIKTSKLKSFLTGEFTSEELTDRWGNLIAHSCEYISDPLLHDVLRAFTTLQLLSIKQSNSDKFNGILSSESAIIVTGNISNLLTKRELLFSLIDGLELEGVCDLFIDKENKLFSFGKSIIDKEKSQDIVILRGDVLPKAIKILIPEVPIKSKNKVIFSGKVSAQGVAPRDIYAFGSSLQILKVPDLGEKIIVEGQLKNGTLFSHYTFTNIEFMSTKRNFEYEELVVDARCRPIVYGPNPQDNRNKFKIWKDADKE